MDALLEQASILDQKAFRRFALPLTVDQYHRFAEAGALPENAELLEGFLFIKMTKTPRHSHIVRRIQSLLHARLTAGMFLSVEQPLGLPDSEPEPDLAVIAGRLEDYEDAHPATAQLVIEVAQSSLELDRAKGRVYARAGVPEYWIVNLADNCFEVYTEPLGATDGYRTRRLYRSGDVLPLAALGDGELAVADVLG